MAVLADIEFTSCNPHPRLIVDQLKELIPLDYCEPSSLGSSMVKLLCMDSMHGITAEQCYISIDPAQLSWLPGFVEVLDEEYQQVMAIVNGIEENGAMHDRDLDARLLAIGRRGFKARITRLPQYDAGNAFLGLELLYGSEYTIRSHKPEADQEPGTVVPMVFTATPDGKPIDLRMLNAAGA